MKVLFKFVIPVCSAVYLAIFIGLRAGFSISKNIFLGVLLFWLFQNLSGVIYERFVARRSFDKRMLWISPTAAAFLLLVTGDRLTLKLKPNTNAVVTITSLGEKNKDALSSEVWITAIHNGSTDIELNKIPVDSGWDRKGNALLSVRIQPASLNIWIENPSAPSIVFTSHAWSGKVKIKDGEQENVVDLYKPGPTGGEYKYGIKNVLLTEDPRSAELRLPFLVLSFTFFTAVGYLLYAWVAGKRVDRQIGEQNQEKKGI